MSRVTPPNKQQAAGLTVALAALSVAVTTAADPEARDALKAAWDWLRELLEQPANSAGGVPGPVRVSDSAELGRLVGQMVAISERGCPDYLRIVSHRLFPRESWERMRELAGRLAGKP